MRTEEYYGNASKPCASSAAVRSISMTAAEDAVIPTSNSIRKPNSHPIKVTRPVRTRPGKSFMNLAETGQAISRVASAPKYTHPGAPQDTGRHRQCLCVCL